MIYVSSLEGMPAAVAEVRPSHLISLLDPGHEVATPPGIEPSDHLHLGVHDISQPFAGYVAPETEHIESLLEFGAGWTRAAPLLVHCWAGISRSTAAALILAARLNPGRERELVALLSARAGHAMPNRRMIALADDLMGCEGRLVTAVTAMPLPDMASAGELVALPAAL